MTTITVVRKDGVAAIAADTASKWGYVIDRAEYVVNHTKILEVGESFVVAAGSTAMKAALRHYFSSRQEVPTLATVEEIFSAWLDLHRALKEEYYLNPQEDSDDSFESTRCDVLIANAHGIFGVGAHRAVQEFSRFYAYGGGREFAMGAMYALYEGSLSAEEIAQAGVRAAAEFDESTAVPVISRSLHLRS